MGYWSEVAASVRGEAAACIERWLEPIAERRILWLGPGGDAPVRRWTEKGGRLSSSEALPAVPCEDLDAAVAIEFLDALSPERQEEGITALAGLPCADLFVGVRVEVAGRALVSQSMPVVLRTTTEPTRLLRHVHLTTHFRLLRRERVVRRRFALELWHLRRF